MGSLEWFEVVRCRRGRLSGQKSSDAVEDAGLGGWGSFEDGFAWDWNRHGRRGRRAGRRRAGHRLWQGGLDQSGFIRLSSSMSRVYRVTLGYDISSSQQRTYVDSLALKLGPATQKTQRVQHHNEEVRATTPSNSTNGSQEFEAIRVMLPLRTDCREVVRDPSLIAS